MRKAYHFRAFQVTKIALYHALAKLPEPNTTHRFYGGTAENYVTLPYQQKCRVAVYKAMPYMDTL